MDLSAERRRLVEHMVRHRICGPVATPRESNLDALHRYLTGEATATFGLTSPASWSFERLLALMALRIGIDPDPQRTVGADTIGPELTVEALDRFAAVMREAAESAATVMFGSGHPYALFWVHLALRSALESVGCRVLVPGSDLPLSTGKVRFVGKVAVVAQAGGLLHTHSPEAMNVALDLADALGERPDLVIGDHGFAGAAAERGIRTIGFADSNDPALVVGEHDTKVAVCVGLDDGIDPQHYEPVVKYILARAGLA